MSYNQLFYHLVWATKNRVPSLTDDIEPEVYRLLRGMTIKLKGYVFALNGVLDHIHMVVSLPPTLAVATFLGRIKGSSATLYNRAHPAHPIAWQDDYSAFTCDAHCLSRVIAYVDGQKLHHAQKTTLAMLECTSQRELAEYIRETGPVYDPFTVSISQAGDVI